MPMVTSADIDKVVDGQTVPGEFAKTVANNGDLIAIRWRKPDDSWGEWTYDEYGDKACRMATALAGLGVGKGDRALLMMRNRPEFHIADLGALLCGATPVSVYNSSSPEQIEYLVGHSKGKIAIVEDIDFLERFLKVRSQLPGLERIIVIDDPDGLAPDDVISFSSLLESDPIDMHAAVEKVSPDDLCTVIYTSGTTGPPKGVALSHYNVCWTAESYRQTIKMDPVGFRVLSYLPMAHIAERMTGHYFGIVSASEVTTCPDPGLLGQYLPQVRPQTFFGVPRVWEKLYAGVNAALAADAEKQAKFDEAVGAGKAIDEVRRRGEELSTEQQATWEFLDEVAFQPLKQMIGLDQVKFALTGAAPIGVDLLEWFRAIGVPLTEIYGMSENTGPLTWDPYKPRIGTVGPAMPGVALKLLEDGEVCAKGGNVFSGYLDDPEKTAEALDDEGWLHTGDIGVLDDAGYLKIVDRKKELIITAGGKNISPANLENALKSFPLIGQAAVIGDRRPYISALIVLDGEVAPAWAKARGLSATTVQELAADPEVLAEIERSVAEANKRFSNVEQIKRWTLLADEWLPDSEELTPTMKLKRRGVNSRYAAEIEALYEKKA
ncbi:MAG TPA: AMP-dependent synthetase/ligase [Acidimicrobiales bacterium]|nr:AMP-dependent synthetase/ligase [Acidimicrobiales bacterium]